MASGRAETRAIILKSFSALLLDVLGRERFADWFAEHPGTLYDRAEQLLDQLPVDQTPVSGPPPAPCVIVPQAVKKQASFSVKENRLVVVVSPAGGDPYSRQVSRKNRDVALSLEIFLMAQALERAGDHAKNLAEEVCHLVEGRTMRHQRAFH